MDALLEAAGCDPGTSLAALCGAAAAVHFPGAGNSAELVSLLGAHSQIVAGRHVASVLLQRTSPAAFLAADQVAAQLQQNIHSSSSPFTHRAGQLHGGCHIGEDTPGTKSSAASILVLTRSLVICSKGKRPRKAMSCAQQAREQASHGR